MAEPGTDGPAARHRRRGRRPGSGRAGAEDAGVAAVDDAALRAQAATGIAAAAAGQAAGRAVLATIHGLSGAGARGDARGQGPFHVDSPCNCGMPCSNHLSRMAGGSGQFLSENRLPTVIRIQRTLLSILAHSESLVNTPVLKIKYFP